jgi:hypothetical protein
MIVIPRRGKGRPSAAGAAAYREQVEAFCAGILEIRGTLDFEVSARGWCYILEEHGATKADFPTIERLFVDLRKSGDLARYLRRGRSAGCRSHRERDRRGPRGVRRGPDRVRPRQRLRANALVVRPEAGRQLCLDAIRRYIPDDLLSDFEARREAARHEARAAVARLLAQ